MAPQVVSPLPQQQQQTGMFVNRKPRFPTKYDEMLQPLCPVITLPVESSYSSHHAARPKVNVELQEELMALLRGSNLNEIELFLREHSENVDLNVFDPEFGQTPLHDACQLGQLELVKILVQYGANHRLTNRDGFALLHLASFAGNTALMKYIMNIR